MIVIDVTKLPDLKSFPPIKIPQDGTLIGIDQIKNIIDISYKSIGEVKNIIGLKDKGILKKLFGGYIRFALFALDTGFNIYEAVPILSKEIKDLDLAEIEELTIHLAKTHKLDEEKALAVFEFFKKVLGILEDGVFKLAELKDF